MECKASDSKKLFQVFDATKRKRGKKKRDGEGRSIGRSVSDTSTNGQIHVVSAKASLQETLPSKTDAFPSFDERNADSSPSIPSQRSPRRNRRPARRDTMSLALKAGLASTPRSGSPQRDGDATFESMPKDQGSFIYAFLEEAIKRDKKKQRHARRHEERDRASRRAASPERVEREPRERRDQRDQRDHEDYRPHRDHREHRDHRHHRRRDDSPEIDKPVKNENPPPVLDQNVLIETFAKLCATLTTKTETPPSKTVQRSLSHKSLQCEGVSRQPCNDVDHQPVKLRSFENSQGNIPLALVRSQEDNTGRIRSRDNVASSRSHLAQVTGRSSYCVPYDKENTLGEQQRYREQYTSKLDVSGSKMHTPTDDRRREYAPRPAPTRSGLNQSCRGYRENHPNREPLRDRDYRRESDREYDRDIELNRDYDRITEPNRERSYEDDKKRYCNQTSRSYDAHRNSFVEDDRQHRTSRSDNHRERCYNERLYEDRDRKRCEDMEKRDKYYEDKPFVSRDRNYHAFKESRDRRYKKNLERFDRASVTSRETERERDSGLSVADCDSTVSARSNYLKLVKQEIMEQREAMDKMMNLWKELMRCFKGYSQTSGEKAVTETAANSARDSAAAQLRLWRECMRRYETVARDVGDTDARLIQTTEEINKQRSEMAEMASMWQECLQRYREMSNDFNNLKQKLAAPAASAVVVQPLSAEGEGAGGGPAAFCQPAYPPPTQMPGAGYATGPGSPVRGRASAPAPPPWWWGEPSPARAARRSSPESRGSCERHRNRERHRHKERERDDSKYKDKSKPTTARSEHRRRKR